MGEKLKACPFCGGEAEIERVGTARMSTIYFCTECSCRLETGETFNHGALWNRRAMPSQGGEAVAMVSVWNIDPWYATDLSMAGRNIGVKFLGDHAKTLVDGQSLYTHQADQVVDGVVVSRELLEQWANDLALHGVGDIETAQKIDALLAKP